jgi:hypothetical protein
MARFITQTRRMSGLVIHPEQWAKTQLSRST